MQLAGLIKFWKSNKSRFRFNSNICITLMIMLAFCCSFSFLVFLCFGKEDIFKYQVLSKITRFILFTKYTLNSILNLNLFMYLFIVEV